MWWELVPVVLAIGSACVAVWHAGRLRRASLIAEAEARRAEHYAARTEHFRRRTCERAKHPPTGGVTPLG